MFRILDNLSECVLAINESGQIKYTNSALEKVFGYASLELINKPLAILIPKQYSDHHQKYIRSYFQAPSSMPMFEGRDLNGLHKNGTIFPIEVSISYTTVENKRMAIAIVVDVTKQRRLLNELNLSKSLYSSIVENNVDHIFQLNKDMTILYINHVSPGLTKDRVLGANLLDLLPNEKTKTRVKKIVNRVFETGMPELYDIEFPSPVGSINYSTTVSPVINNGEVIGVNLISRDYTEQINLKNSLLEKQKFIDKISGYGLNGIYVYNLKLGRYTYINKAYERILGYKLSEINSMSQEELFSNFHPEDQQIIIEHMSTVSSLAEGEMAEAEYRFRSKSGKWIWCKSNDSGFEYDNKGELVSFIGSFIDITPQKESEQLLKQHSAEMESYAYVVSHDLRSPLSNMIQSLEYLISLDFINDDTNKSLMDMLLGSAYRANEMIKSLLLRATIDQEQTIEQFDTNKIIEELKIDLYKQIQESNTIISTQNLPIIFGVSPLFRLLLQNLISNSIKYKADSRHPQINISCNENSSHWIFTVKDNGSGIPKKDIENIFKMFNRSSNHSEIEGLGIGLSNCQKIVTLHKGDIRVESEVEKGTKFIFTISKGLKATTANK